MIRSASEDAASLFPLRESFVDCCGRTREFIIDLSRSDDPRFLTAVEATDEQGRYEFAAMSESGPYQALGKLRRTIRREPVHAIPPVRAADGWRFRTTC